MNWFKKQDPGTGLIEDPRSAGEKSKDYQFKEIVSAAAVVDWEPKDFSTIRQFTVRNQKNSSTCVAQTIAKTVEVMLWLKENTKVPFSATQIYKKRANKPGEGMWGQNAFEIAQEGVILETLVPSQNMSESQINNYEIENYENEVGKVFKIANYIALPVGDMETVASTIQVTKKAVALGFFFTSAEWSKEIPTVDNPNLTRAQALGHYVSAVDFGIYKGKHGLFIEDSAHFGGKNRRFITEDFFIKRNTAAIYPINFKFQESVPPAHVFTTVMRFGEQNSEIVELQNVLKALACFPVGQTSTGYYGSITATAVGKFQAMKGLPINTKVVEGQTLQKLNEI